MSARLAFSGCFAVPDTDRNARRFGDAPEQGLAEPTEVCRASIRPLGGPRIGPEGRRM